MRNSTGPPSISSDAPRLMCRLGILTSGADASFIFSCSQIARIPPSGRQRARQGARLGGGRRPQDAAAHPYARLLVSPCFPTRRGKLVAGYAPAIKRSLHLRATRSLPLQYRGVFLSLLAYLCTCGRLENLLCDHPKNLGTRSVLIPPRHLHYTGVARCRSSA